MQKVIDAHFHVFDFNQFEVEWVKSVAQLCKPILLKDYINDTSNQNNFSIVGAVHVELDSIPQHKVAENRYFIEQAEESGNLIKSAAIWVDMFDKKLEEKIKEFYISDSVSSVRYILHVPTEKPGTCLEEQFIKNINILGKYNLQFEVCMRAEELPDLITLARMCPETDFILNHMGLPDLLKMKSSKEYANNWRDSISQLGKLNNVTCKISGLSSSDIDRIKPLILHCFNSFENNRVMYASNYPVCTLDFKVNTWTEALIEICKDYPEEFRDKFFYKNALKIYRIKEI